MSDLAGRQAMRTAKDVLEWAAQAVSNAVSNSTPWIFTRPDTATAEYLAACVLYYEGRFVRAFDVRAEENERLRVAFERNPGASVDDLYRAIKGDQR